jgi:phage terminase large subunit-like protein
MALSLARPDWEARIRAGQSLIPDAAFGINPAEYQRAVELFDLLHIPDVPGMPAFKEAAGEWFRQIVGTFLGSICPITGARLIRELFLLVPKKNSKTTGGAGIMVDALMLNRRPRAEFLFIGPTQAVSDLAFDQAAGMIENDPYGVLQKRFHIQNHLKTIGDRKNGAELKIKTFDAKVLTGVKPVGVLIDELHEISKNSRAAKVIGQIRGGILPNPEGFLAFITTQSDDPPQGAFRSELMVARAIRDGRQGGAMMPVLYELPDDISRSRDKPPKWQDPQYWHMVLPNLGKPVTLDRLIEDFDTAKTKGEEEIRRWASQHINLEIGLALRSDRWVGADYWEGAAEASLVTLEDLLDRCEVVCIGIDGGGLDDLLGFAAVGREKETRRWLIWTHTWAHKIALERRKDIAPALMDYAAAGELTIVERPDQDVEEVADLVEQIDASGLLPDENAIGVDPVGIAQIVDEIKARELAGEDGKRIIGISQGWKLSGAIKTCERGLSDGTIVHAPQRSMNWAIGNCMVEPRGNAITITKQAAGSMKIDPVMGMFNGIALMSLNPQPQSSVFDLLADAAAAQPSDEPTHNQDKDLQILADPRHPEFEAARERINAHLAAQPDEDL